MSLSTIPTVEKEIEVPSKHEKSFKIPILQSETSYFKADLVSIFLTDNNLFFWFIYFYF